MIPDKGYREGIERASWNGSSPLAYHRQRAIQERKAAAECRDCISRSEHEELAELHEDAVARLLAFATR